MAAQLWVLGCEASPGQQESPEIPVGLIPGPQLGALLSSGLQLMGSRGQLLRKSEEGLLESSLLCLHTAQDIGSSPPVGAPRDRQGCLEII